ncbi:Flagellar hook-length control protein FliK [Lachnospiraceae bacterium]|nr:Flagellar hook-length control protein FliK [Lachnospiraceae bacterium]
MNIQVNPNTGLYDTGSGVNRNVSITDVTQSPATEMVDSDKAIYVKSGDTFSGQVVGMNKDGTVQLLLANNSTISAKLNQNIPLSMGQTLSFQVSGASSSKITITPLYANLDGNSEIGRALAQAGLPLTDRNGEMVSSMMGRGLPINALSLNGMADMVAAHPSASATTVVQMTQLGIPLTEENIAEFEMYKSSQYQIAESVDGLSKGFAELAGENVGMHENVTNIFFGAQNVAVASAAAQAVQGDPTALLSAFGIETAAVVTPEVNQPVQAVDPSVHPDSAEGDETGSEDNSRQDQDNMKANISLTDRSHTDDKTPEGGVRNAEVGKEDTALAQDITGHVTNNITELLSRENLQALTNSLSKMGVPPELTDKILQGELSSSETLHLTRAMVSEAMSGKYGEDIQAAAREVIQSKPYQFLLKNGIMDQFLLKPTDVSDKETVRQYFRKIAGEAEQATQMLNDLGKSDTPLAQGMKSLSSNLNFMEQMNQVMTYIQLPLKMNNSKAHGDLYVYTNKRNLARKDGNISALLHLDMEHLGQMDIHVSMNQAEKVQTHFILQDESMLDFIGEHLPELDEALRRRGYKIHSDVSLNKEAKSVPDIMFNRGVNEKLIQVTGFDVRA